MEIARCLQCPRSIIWQHGLCVNCYSKCARSVRDGKTTWDELVQKGQAATITKSPWTKKGYGQRRRVK